MPPLPRLLPLPGPELDAEIAVRFFGWQWWLYPAVPGRPAMAAIQPPLPYTRWNWPEDAMLLPDGYGNHPRFRGWERALDGDSHHSYPPDPSCPSTHCSTRLLDAMGVVANRRAVGYRFSATEMKEGLAVSFTPPGASVGTACVIPLVDTTPSSFELALAGGICYAALDTLLVERGEKVVKQPSLQAFQDAIRRKFEELDGESDAPPDGCRMR